MHEKMSHGVPQPNGELMSGEHVGDTSLEREEEDVLELTEYQAFTSEQGEAHDRIAKIDADIQKLDTIIHSVDRRAMSEGRRENEAAADTIAELDRQLMDMTIAGEDTSELEAKLFELKAKQKEGDEFFDTEKHLMFSGSLGYESSAASEKLRNKSSEELDETTQALLTILEGMGLDREEFLKRLNSVRRSDYREADHVEQLLSEFRATLVLQRNTERLNLPNELPKMTGELLTACEAAGISDKDVFPYGEHRMNDVTVNQVFEKLPFNRNKKIDAYPPEVQQQFFTEVARRLIQSVGGNTYEAGVLGKDLAKLRAIEGEQFRSKEDIAFEVDTLKKVLGFAEAEQRYLQAALQDNVQFKLEDKIDDWGIRYDPTFMEAGTERNSTWPIVDSSVKFAVEKIRDRGGFMLREFDFADRYRRVMVEALAVLKETHPGVETVGATEIMEAMSKATERVRVELETLEAEQDHLEMHTQDLTNLRRKLVTSLK